MDSNVIELRRLQRQLYRRRVWLSQIGCGVLLSPFLGVAVLIFALRPTPWDGPIEAIYREWPYDSASGMRIVLDIRKDGSYLQTVYSPEPDDKTRQYYSLWYYDRKENELSFIDYHIVGPGNTDPQVWYVGKRNNEPYLSGDDRSDRDNFKRIVSNEAVSSSGVSRCLDSFDDELRWLCYDRGLV
jgi:hypothetical protein